MELVMRKAQPQDLDGLDQVMLVISDAAGERGKVLRLLEHITADPQKYLLVAEDMDTGTICGSLFGVVFEDICDSCRPILLVENVAVLEKNSIRSVDLYLGAAIAGLVRVPRWAKEEWDCHYEILASGLNRTGAHKFYHALGFEEVKGFKKYL